MPQTQECFGIRHGCSCPACLLLHAEMVDDDGAEEDWYC